MKNLTILYEDSHIIVCKKPAGIAVQSSSLRAPDLVSLLKNYLFQTMTIKKQPYLAVIHRLDQPVEGILVFAKTPSAAKNLNQQLQTKHFGKYYTALLTSIPEKDKDTLVHYMVKNGRTNTSHICTADTPGAKKGILSYHILAKKEHTAAVSIKLETGRHHQIRVQMAFIGCPLEGDQKYGSPASNNTQLKLSSCRLTFQHPVNGKEMDFRYTPDFLKNFM